MRTSLTRRSGWIALGAALGCGSSSNGPGGTPAEPAEEMPPTALPSGGMGMDPGPAPERAQVSVRVDLATRGASVQSPAFGLHTSVYDNALHVDSVPGLLNDAGIALLRYPGGGYADNYHWSTHRMTPWADGMAGYLAPGSDFGRYVSFVERVSAGLMITVNYGSNLQGNGPGEPKEAAAWVAYANGAAGDATSIGFDGAGNDWRSVDFWASLRAAAPLAVDDGFNFLRIAHPEPLGVVYWEIGNEVFGNGYYEGRTFELDLHVPYDGTERAGHPELSPARYGRGVHDFALAMKAVDPSIQVGAVLNTPPNDNGWGPTWNADVLAGCANDVDFVIVHLYAGRNAAALLRLPTTRIPGMLSEVRNSIAAAAGARADRVQIALTEIGPRPGFPEQDMRVSGLFAADAYVTLMEHGVINVDWLELHNGTFLAESTQAKGPAYHGILMASRLAAPGDTFLRVETTASWDAQAVAAHAVARQDGTLGLMLVNRADGTLLEASVEIPGGSFARTGVRYDYILGGTPGAALGPTPAAALGDDFALELAPHSVTVLTLQPE